MVEGQPLDSNPMPFFLIFNSFFNHILNLFIAGAEGRMSTYKNSI